MGDAARIWDREGQKILMNGQQQERRMEKHRRKWKRRWRRKEEIYLNRDKWKYNLSMVRYDTLLIITIKYKAAEEPLESQKDSKISGSRTALLGYDGNWEWSFTWRMMWKGKEQSLF